jgi:hypothetical protein
MIVSACRGNSTCHDGFALIVVGEGRTAGVTRLLMSGNCSPDAKGRAAPAVFVRVELSCRMKESDSRNGGGTRREAPVRQLTSVTATYRTGELKWPNP